MGGVAIADQQSFSVTTERQRERERERGREGGRERQFDILPLKISLDYLTWT